VRLNAGAAITSSIVISGDGVTEYGVCKIAISKSKSAGTGACAGCTTGACLTLNEINFQPAAQDAAWTRFTNPTVDGSNVVSYNKTFASCAAAATPVRNRSWGAIKALYH
jgi:hypothetical protein